MIKDLFGNEATLDKETKQRQLDKGKTKTKLGYLPTNMWDIRNGVPLSLQRKIDKLIKDGKIDWWDIKKEKFWNDMISDADKEVRFVRKEGGLKVKISTRKIKLIPIGESKLEFKLAQEVTSGTKILVEANGEKIEDDYEFTDGIIKFDNEVDEEYSSVMRAVPFESSDYPYSEFNGALAERIINMWSEPGDLIVDPFGGRATRAIVSATLGRDYIGYEISPKTHSFTVERLAIAINKKSNIMGIFGDTKSGDAKVILGDGVKIEGTEDNVADFIMTCPPYYTIEPYESVDGQLTDAPSYGEFMKSMNECAKNCFRVLKPGKFMVWVVGDFRVKGIYYTFADDLTQMFKSAGFAVHDKITNKLYSGFAAMAIGQAVKCKRTAKTTEYVMVFKKPREGDPVQTKDELFTFNGSGDGND